MAGRDRSQLLIGIFLAVIGILFLLNSFGVIRGFNWWLLLRLWPLLLVFIGLNLLLKSTRLWWLVPLLLVLVIVGLFVTDQPFRGRFFFPMPFNRDFHFSPINIENRSTYRSSAELTEGIEGLEVELSFEAGRLDIGSLSEEELLYKLDLQYREITPEVIYYQGKENGIARLKIDRNRDGDWNDIGDKGNDWQLYFSPNVALDLSINAGAGQFEFDLADLQAREVTVNVGAGDLDLSLGRESRSLILNSGAANVELNLPGELALEIVTTGVISTNNFTEVGLVREGNKIYRSADYAEAADRLKIVISAAASRIELNLD